MPTTDTQDTAKRESASIEVVANDVLTLPVAEAKYLAKAGATAASKDDVTPIITGVLLSAENDVVKVVGTDRYRVHRATVEAEGALLAPILVPRKAMEWIVANGNFFGRHRHLLVEPIVTFAFTRGEESSNENHPTSTPCPAGFVTVTITENATEDAARISFTTALIKGNYPLVERMLDDAAEAEPVSDEKGTLDLRMISATRCLARFTEERALVKFVGIGTNSRAGQALVSYAHGSALIQKGF